MFCQQFNCWQNKIKVIKEAPTMFDLSDDEILSLSKEHVFYTWSAQSKVNPIAVKRAQGVYFWDAEVDIWTW